MCSLIAKTVGSGCSRVLQVEYPSHKFREITTHSTATSLEKSLFHTVPLIGFSSGVESVMPNPSKLQLEIFFQRPTWPTSKVGPLPKVAPSIWMWRASLSGWGCRQPRALAPFDGSDADGERSTERHTVGRPGERSTHWPDQAATPGNFGIGGQLRQMETGRKWV